MLTVHWVKNTAGGWCGLDVDLTGIKTEGVYAIWFAAQPGVRNCVRVGQGKIIERVTKHRADPAITAYRQKGALYVTWAAVPAAQRDGVEKFLADTYNPLVGDAFPNVAPIAVNLPA
jgi:hypothetical protein